MFTVVPFIVLIDLNYVFIHSFFMVFFLLISQILYIYIGPSGHSSCLENPYFMLVFQVLEFIYTIESEANLNWDLIFSCL